VFTAAVASARANVESADRSLVGVYLDTATQRVVRLTLIAPLQAQ
jgi:hypothetical protein